MTTKEKTVNEKVLFDLNGFPKSAPETFEDDTKMIVDFDTFMKKYRQKYSDAHYTFNSYELDVLERKYQDDDSYAPAFVGVDKNRKTVQLLGYWLDVPVYNSDSNIEKLAHMKVDKANAKANLRLYDLDDWFSTTPYTQQIQKDIKKICYNLLKYFDASEFPNGTFSFVNCYGDSLYNRGVFKYKNNEFNILVNRNGINEAYIYEKDGFEPIWSISDVTLKEAIEALQDKLNQLNPND